ncbi:ABC transporter permease [Paenibacillus sedimenti]|uniref:Proline/glycine betaine ABC transporter permease n=1 Tax=Paenibacillus sedimenti TaxID=2770274 RepID=A0A926KNR3_9BACL|nr:proline/glycine betaine ABC transporter permease [Paenibacillus sedimenti]MBD0379499.1 proline/glycine betaine ABC transporter permease [Paenibacillus sedimenti]
MIPKIPLDEWVEKGVDGLESNLTVLFQMISTSIEGSVNALSYVFHFIPPLLFIAWITILAYYLGRWPFAVFSAAGLILIENLGYWNHTMDTLALVMTSALISIIVGIPLGVWCAQSDKVRKFVTPLLDFMQTMPAFVYLIPAVTFFGLGVVPGVIASVIFAVPPTIRLTNLGIRQVAEDLVEAADAFGSTPTQKLFKLQFPLAMPSIMAGINQTIMLALSMVVIASMIGAQGIGADVYRAVTQIKTGQGFEAGLSIVVLAILLDRMMQYLLKKKGVHKNV